MLKVCPPWPAMPAVYSEIALKTVDSSQGSKATLPRRHLFIINCKGAFSA